MSERKLKAWEAAGLIDSATAGRIREWEAAHQRPLGLWALFGIAALAIGLGLISLVAANWDEIAGEVRLGIHFALLAGLAGWLWFKRSTHEALDEALDEALLFIVGALGLTFFGHIGQVYQTSSPLWQPLALWLVLFTPLLLGFGRSWLAAAGWFAVFAGMTLSLVSHLVETGGDNRPDFVLGLLGGLPVLATALGAWQRGRSSRPEFWRRIEQVALIYAVLGASYLLIISAFHDSFGPNDGVPLAAHFGMAIVGVVTAGAVWKLRPGASGTAVAAILAVASGLILLSEATLGSDIIAALLFMTLWAAIATASLHGGWRAVFQVATAVIALRLIVLSFELASDLLGSGIGLILAGLFTLAVAWIAVRVSKRYAPKEDAA